MQIKKITILLFVLFVFYGCKSTDDKSELSKDENFLKYEDNKISFYYPGNWTIIKKNVAGAAVNFRIPYVDKNSRIYSSFDIMIYEDINDNMTLYDYNEFMLSNARKISKNYEFISSDEILIDKNKSIRSIFRFLVGDSINMKAMYILTLKNNRAYIFGYGSLEAEHDKNIPMIEKMVKSIKIY